MLLSSLPFRKFKGFGNSRSRTGGKIKYLLMLPQEESLVFGLKELGASDYLIENKQFSSENFFLIP